MNTNPPSDLQYSDMGNFPCPYDYECETCGYDCEVTINES